MNRYFVPVNEDRSSNPLRQNYSGFIRVKVYSHRFIFNIKEITDIEVVKNLVINSIQEVTKCSNQETESIFEAILKYLLKNRK